MKEFLPDELHWIQELPDGRGGVYESMLCVACNKNSGIGSTHLTCPKHEENLAWFLEDVKRGRAYWSIPHDNVLPRVQ